MYTESVFNDLQNLKTIVEIDMDKISVSIRDIYIVSWMNISAVNFFKKFLEDISPFRGATDTPILDFWWRLPWVSHACFLACAQRIP